MNLEKNENEALFWHIPDRQLSGMIGTSKSIFSNARQDLIRERLGIEKVVKNVDTSKMRIIGRGDQSVYLYYFPAYKLNSWFSHIEMVACCQGHIPFRLFSAEFRRLDSQFFFFKELTHAGVFR